MVSRSAITFFLISIDNLEIVPGAVLRAEDAQQGTDTLSSRTALTDDTADIFRVNAQTQQDATLVDFTLDNDLIWIVYKGFYDIFYKLLVNGCHKISSLLML